MRFITSSARIGAALVVASLVACHETTSPGDDAEVSAAIATFQRVADSLSISGADPSVVSGYYRLSSFLRMSPRATPATLVVDGVSRTFLAVARENEVDEIQCVTAPCFNLPALRTVVAWRRDDPRQVVQLTGVAGATIGLPLATPMASRFTNYATLTWLDGRGGFYVGTNGGQTVTLDRLTDEPCSREKSDVLRLADLTDALPLFCRLADFTVSFDATLQPPLARGPRNNTAAGVHTLAMAAQHVAGSRVSYPAFTCFGCPLGEYPFPLIPPVDITPRTRLAATLSVTGTDVITFTYTIKNAGTTPEVIPFGTGQRYDFAVVKVPEHTVIWRWRADKYFAQVLGTLTLAPSQQIVFTEQWTPATKGDFIAEAQLWSPTYDATADTYFHVQ